MKAVSIKQPWGSLIAHGIKDIENRTWPIKFRGRIYIHVSAAKKFNIELTDEQTKLAIPILGKAIDGTMPFGAIIGEVDIIDCVINAKSIWAEQSDLSEGAVFKPIYNWVLANAKLYDKPILNVKGKLSFWYPDNDIVECIGCSQKFDSKFMEEDDGGEKFCSECWEELSPIMTQEAKEIKESEL